MQISSRKSTAHEVAYTVLLASGKTRVVKASEVKWTDSMVTFSGADGAMIAAFPLDGVYGVLARKRGGK